METSKPEITLIAAIDSERGIGIKGQLPWRLSKDMAFFKEKTIGNTVIMGRKTWESIPPKFRPLPDRTNIVVTRNPDALKDEPAIIATSLDDAIGKADTGTSIFVIGGGTLYEEAIRHPACTTLILTEIDYSFECDTFFPNYRSSFILSESSATLEERGLPFRFNTYIRHTW